MADHVRTRAGAVLLQRLGALHLGEQSRWSRAPEARGMWAFPWPHFEMFFAYHQYADRMPKRLRMGTDRYPVHLSAYVDDDGNPPPEGMTRLAVIEDDRFSVRGGWWDERDAWVRDVGRHVVKRRTFWHPGLLYTHLTPRGEILEQDQWQLMPATTFAEAIRRSGGLTTYAPRTAEKPAIRYRGAADHLEVFIPAGSRRR